MTITSLASKLVPHLINGQLIYNADDRSQPVYNPATGQSERNVALASRATVEQAKVLGVTMEDIMGEPIEQVPQASPEDVAFFREYAGMTEDEKKHYQDVLKMMFSRKSGD